MYISRDKFKMDVIEVSPKTALVSSLIFGGVIKYAALNWISSRRQMALERVGKVSALYFYPVKSLNGLKVKEGFCSKTGLEVQGQIDRHWMIIDEKKVSLTQRTDPKMVLITPSFHDNSLHLDAPNMVTIKVSFDDVSKNSANPVECKCREVPMTGVDCGDEVAEWLTKVIGKANLRLVYSGPGLKKRDVLERAKNVTLAKSGNLVAYPDYTPYHLATDDSLADLNNKAQHPVAMDNFRANIIVKATDPFEEDYWREVRIGEATFQNVRLTTRCKLTQIDPKNGEPDNVTKDPINTLRKYRRFKELGDSPCFGINLTINQTGPIKVGDEVFATRHALRACCES